MAKRLERESVIAIESVLKRKLQPHEIESGVLDRQPRKATLPTRSMTDEELLAHVMTQPYNTGPFKPVAKSDDSADPFASVVAEAAQAAEHERVNSLPPAARKLYEAKAAQAQYAKENADKAALAAHLKKYESALKALNELSEAVAADPYYTAEDVAAIQNAIAQIEFGPTADEATTKKLLANVEAVKANTLKARKDGVAAKLKEAGLSDTEIADVIAKRFPDASKKATEAKTPTGAPEWFAMSDKTDELRAVWDGLKADKTAKPEDVSAARKAWADQVEATHKARTEWNAAQDAAASTEGAAT